MPNTGRQRYIITATWGETGTTPVSYTKRRLTREGYALDAESVAAVDLADAGMVRVKFPAAVPGAASLAFNDAGAANADSDANVLDFARAQDRYGDDLVITGVADSLGKSRAVPLDLVSCLYVQPVFLDSGGDPIQPGKVSVEFHIKE